MLHTSSEVDIDLYTRQGENCLHFKFKGKFTQEASIVACQKWIQEFRLNGNKKYVLIWDCLEMDGFEMAARNEWLNCMTTLKNRIDQVVVISDSVIIRGAARLMLQLFSFKSEVYKSLTDFNQMAVA